MKNINKFLNKHITFLLIIFYAVGLVGFNIPGLKILFYQLTPITILLSVFFLLYFHSPYNARFITISLFIAFGGFFVEVAGVQTGIIFGGYTYGITLGLKLMETPLMIGINWLMLTYCTYVLLSRTNYHLLIKSLIAAFLMLAYDVVLEPVAIHTGMWTWDNISVPLQNYLAWFVISLFFQLLMHLFRVKIENKIASPLFKIQFLFFLLLSLEIVLF